MCLCCCIQSSSLSLVFTHCLLLRLFLLQVLVATVPIVYPHMTTSQRLLNGFRAAADALAPLYRLFKAMGLTHAVYSKFDEPELLDDLRWVAQAGLGMGHGGRGVSDPSCTWHCAEGFSMLHHKPGAMYSQHTAAT